MTKGAVKDELTPDEYVIVELPDWQLKISRRVPAPELPELVTFGEEQVTVTGLKLELNARHCPEFNNEVSVWPTHDDGFKEFW